METAHINIILIVVFCILSVLDFISTVKGIKAGAKESFRVSKWFIEKFGLVKGLIIVRFGLASIAAGLFFLIIESPFLTIALLCFEFFYCRVIIKNFKIARKLEK